MTTIKTKGKVSDLDSCEREDEGKEMETLGAVVSGLRFTVAVVCAVTEPRELVAVSV